MTTAVTLVPIEEAGVLPDAWTMPDGRKGDMLMMVLKKRNLPVVFK